MGGQSSSCGKVAGTLCFWIKPDMSSHGLLPKALTGPRFVTPVKAVSQMLQMPISCHAVTLIFSSKKWV